MEDRRLAAIVFTDIVGYSSLMAKDENTALATVQQQRAIFQPIVTNHGGQWLKEMGDGTLSSFPSASRAVQAAIEIQDGLKTQDQLKVRIGIHLGDVVFTESDVFGDGVNIASRIESVAEPGGIAITGQVFDTLSSNKNIETVFLGEKQLKNIDRPIRVYGVSNNALPVGKPWVSEAPKDAAHQKPSALNTSLYGKPWPIPLLIIAVVLSVAWFATRSNQQPVEPAQISNTAAAPRDISNNASSINPEEGLDVQLPSVDSLSETLDSEVSATPPQPVTNTPDPEAKFITPVLESVPAFDNQSQPSTSRVENTVNAQPEAADSVSESETPAATSDSAVVDIEPPN